MASNTESFAEIVKEMRSECADDEIDVAYTQPELMARLGRLEAAHRREIGKLQETILALKDLY